VVNETGEKKLKKNEMTISDNLVMVARRTPTQMFLCGILFPVLSAYAQSMTITLPQQQLLSPSLE